MRYLAKVAYDGYDFMGFQKQRDERTVQGEIERILSQIFDQPITIFGSGRTDRGVHAKGQHFHFDVESDVDTDRLRYSVNRMICKEIHLIFIKKVDEAFHARFSATGKEYHYLLSVGEEDPFARRYRYFLNQDLDLDRVRTAAGEFIGTHDFKCFTSKKEDEQAFIRTIHSLDVARSGEIITFRISGTGFMRYMVRMIIGVLVAIGLHKEDIGLAAKLLHGDERNVTHHKLPGHGLYLIDVKYDGGDYSDTI